MDMKVGTVKLRSEVHDEYGGSRQGGVSTATKSQTVLLFTDRAKGPRHGYVDGWGADGCYHYTGRGKVGDQTMTEGNKFVLQHVSLGRRLLLWEAVSTGKVAFRGEFAVDLEKPYYTADALDDNSENRSVIIFRLRPIAGTPTQSAELEHTPAPEDLVTDAPLEQHQVISVKVKSAQERTVRKREAELVANYYQHLTGLGHEVKRKKIIPIGEQRALYSDLFDITDNVLVEAKGAATRENIRMAVGQLLDYERFIKPSPRLAMLLPARPRKNLLDLCASLSIDVVWAHGAGFKSLGQVADA